MFLFLTFSGKSGLKDVSGKDDGGNKRLKPFREKFIENVSTFELFLILVVFMIVTLIAMTCVIHKVRKVRLLGYHYGEHEGYYPIHATSEATLRTMSPRSIIRERSMSKKSPGSISRHSKHSSSPKSPKSTVSKLSVSPTSLQSYHF